MTLQEKLEKVEIVLPEIDRLCKTRQSALMTLIGTIIAENGSPNEPSLISTKQLSDAMEGDTLAAKNFRRADTTLRERLHSMPCQVVSTMTALMLTGIALRRSTIDNNAERFDYFDYYNRCENIYCVHGHVRMYECVDVLVNKCPRLTSHVRCALNAIRREED